jgi:hypothetical protein
MNYIYNNRKVFLITAIVIIAFNNLLGAIMQLYSTIRNAAGVSEFVLLFDSILSALSFIITTVITIMILLWLRRGENKKKLLLLVAIDFGRAILFLIWHYIVFPNIVSVTVTSTITWWYSTLYYISLIAMVLLVWYWLKENYLVSKLLLGYVAFERIVIYIISTYRNLVELSFNWYIGLTYTISTVVLLCSLLVYVLIYQYIIKEEQVKGDEVYASESIS